MSGWLRDLVELAKIRITVMVTLTTATGYLLTGHVGWEIWLPLVGTFLLASGSAALNQCQDAGIDARMKRTRERPIPAGRIRQSTGLFYAGVLVLLGLFFLASVTENTGVVLGLGCLALFWYNGVYTYLKRVTAFAVIPGSVIGAIPPVIGWTAAGGDVLDPFILLVASFFFVWQIPHFWLLLLMVGDEYAVAGLPTLTRTFSRPQLVRITFIWVFATAAGGLVFPALAHEVVTLPWSLALVVASVWLTVRAAGVLWRPVSGEGQRPFGRTFLHINVYALMVMVCLSLSGLGFALN